MWLLGAVALLFGGVFLTPGGDLVSPTIAGVLAIGCVALAILAGGRIDGRRARR
jgi:hypothetical protein